MAHFLWTDDLATGNEFIDSDHRKLFTMANALYDAMAKGQANDIIDKVLSNLIIYTKQHFGREEAEMKRIRYISEISHTAEHTKLIMRVAELKASLNAGRPLNVTAVSTFLGDWLRHHILEVDKKLALALKEHSQHA